MTYPCSVTVDERKHDKQEPRLEMYQREQLISSVTKELYESYQEDYDFFLMALSDEEKQDLLVDLILCATNPDPEDDLLEAYYKSKSTVHNKMYKTALFIAEEKARDIWG